MLLDSGWAIESLLALLYDDIKLEEKIQEAAAVLEKVNSPEVKNEKDKLSRETPKVGTQGGEKKESKGALAASASATKVENANPLTGSKEQSVAKGKGQPTKMPTPTLDNNFKPSANLKNLGAGLIQRVQKQSMPIPFGEGRHLKYVQTPPLNMISKISVDGYTIWKDGNNFLYTGNGNFDKFLEDLKNEETLKEIYDLS
jgi:hypothetical protein